uniref:Uncharacterized protein n=1 Tax=Anopheles atroparvus TaxID=41427 RepID=A0A182J397_ANOAO
MADLILRAAVVLCGLTCIANSVDAQYGLRRAPHVLNLEDYDSDEVFPLARRIVPVPDGASFKRNYRSHNHAPMPMTVTPTEQLPLSDDLIKHLETLLIMAQQKKTKAAQKRTRAEMNQIEKQTTLTTATPASTASEPMNRTTEAPATGTPPTTTPANSREIGKKWFPVLLQEAIDNVLRQNDTDDELDELVDHIAAGSRTYRFEASPGDRLAEELSEMFHSSRDNVRPMRREGPSTGENPLGSAVPYVVNVFNNTHIGYIVMKVSNDSEVIVQESQDEGDGPNNIMSAIDFGRRTRKITPAGVVEEELVPLKKSPLSKGYQKLTSHATYTGNPRQHPYGFKSQTPEPPFFNLLKSPEPEPVKYRVLLRNSNDVLSDKVKMRLPVQASIGRTKYQGRQSHGRGRATVPKPALPVLYTQGLDAGKDQKRNSRAGMIDVSSVEFAVDSRPAPGHGRVVRRFDYESLEAESLPYEEAEFTYPDTVTEPTAKLLATGRHDNSLAKASSSERTRTTREPFEETRRYNLRRTFGPMDSTESLERHTNPATATSPTTTPDPDSFEEGELLHQPTTNVFLNSKKDFRRTGETSTSSRRRQRLGDSVENRSGPLKLTFDTKKDPLASLFEMDSGKGKRPYKKAASKRVPLISSEEVRDDSRS